jgi:transposase-like protein
MILENQNTYNSQWTAICSVSPKIGCTPEKLLIWIRQQKPAVDGPDTLTASERQRLKELEREVQELCRSNDICCQASAYFSQAKPSRKA